MSEQILIDIGNNFITFMSAGAGITIVFNLVSYVTDFLLGLIFPSRYGV